MRPGQFRQRGEEPSAGLRELLEDREVIVTRERHVPAFEAVPRPRGLILLGLSNQLGQLTETDGDMRLGSIFSMRLNAGETTKAADKRGLHTPQAALASAT